MSFNDFLNQAYLIAGAFAVREFAAWGFRKVFSGGNALITKLDFEKEKALLVSYEDYQKDTDKLDKRLEEIWKKVDFLVELEIEKSK
jgi:hypothetical protein